jgi:hypothetical protein
VEKRKNSLLPCHFEERIPIANLFRQAFELRAGGPTDHRTEKVTGFAINWHQDRHFAEPEHSSSSKKFLTHLIDRDRTSSMISTARKKSCPLNGKTMFSWCGFADLIQYIPETRLTNGVSARVFKANQHIKLPCKCAISVFSFSTIFVAPL